MAGKILVPEGMMKVLVHSAMRNGLKYDNLPVILEAALLWLAENPIAPDDEQCKQILKTGFGYQTNNWANSQRYLEGCRAAIVEWQRGMFLAPKPEVPDAIKDLLQILPADGSLADPWERIPADVVNDRIIEAYHRGQKAGKS